MPHLRREDREEIESLGGDLYNTVFHALDTEYGGEMAGRVATKTQQAFEKAMKKELEVD